MKRISRPVRLLIVAALVIAAAALLITAIRHRDRPNAFSLSVTHSDGTVNIFVLESDADTLAEALKDSELVEWQTGGDGIFVTTVDGETADLARGSHWSLLRNGELTDYGLDQTILTDWDEFSLVYSTD